MAHAVEHDVTSVARSTGPTVLPGVAIFRQRLFVPSETFVRNQAEMLSRYEPTFVSRGSVSAAPNWATIRTIGDAPGSFADRAFRLTGRSRSLDRVLRALEPDLVHAHFGADGLLCSRTTRALDIPLMVTLHGRDVTVTRRALLASARPIAVRYGLLRHTLAGRATRLLCVSKFLQTKAAALGIPEQELFVHYIGVDTERFSAAPWPRPPLIVHVARLVEKKGTEILIRAMPAVIRRFPDARLVVLGDGPLRPRLEALSRHLNLERQIAFTGFLDVSGVQMHLRRARIVAVPSITGEDGDAEGLPIGLLEAMSTACAIVATKHAGIPEVITDGFEGLLVEERDPSALADAVSHFLADDAAAQHAGVLGAQRVRTSFDLVTQTEALERHYDEIRR